MILVGMRYVVLIQSHRMNTIQSHVGEEGPLLLFGHVSDFPKNRFFGCHMTTTFPTKISNYSLWTLHGGVNG
jgi:hypothetical protein